MENLLRKKYQKINKINEEYDIMFIEITSEEEFEEFYDLALIKYYKNQLSSVVFEEIYNIGCGVEFMIHQ